MPWQSLLGHVYALVTLCRYYDQRNETACLCRIPAATDAPTRGFETVFLPGHRAGACPCERRARAAFRCGMRNGNPFFKIRACCPTRCYAHSNNPGKQFLPLDNSTLLPCARFARSCSKCEFIRDRDTHGVLRKHIRDSSALSLQSVAGVTTLKGAP